MNLELNLKLFDAGTVINATDGYRNAGTGALTSFQSGASLSAEMKDYYNTELIEIAGPVLAHTQFGKKQAIPKGNGKTIKWRKWSNFDKATTPLTEGVTPDGKKMNVTEINQTCDQYGDYVTITDVIDLTAIDNVVLEATDKHGENAGLTLDTVCRNELHKNTNIIYAPIVSGGSVTPVTSRSALTSNAKLTPTLVNMAATFLKKNNAPKIDGYYVCLIHPSVSFDLRESDGWMDVHKYADTVEIFNGEIGKLHGVRFVETTEAKINCGEDLCAASRNLTLSASASASTSLSVSDTLVASALVGRYILVGTSRVRVTANTTNSITVDTAVTASSGATVYPGEGGAAGVATYSCMFIGKDAYGVVDITGGGTEIIVKQIGSAGASDPLEQRGSVGWKSLFAAKILVPEYMCAVECGSTYSSVDVAN